MIESADLFGKFTIEITEYDLHPAKEEQADVFVYCQNLMDRLWLDEDKIAK